MATSPKREAVQAAVLEATEGLLADGASFSDLGVERIARAAGISRTAFYFYFKDKRELLLRLTEDVVAQLYEAAEGWFTGSTDDLTEAIRSIGHLFNDHGPLLKAIVEQSALDEEVAGFWRGLVGRFVDATQARLEREGRGPAAAHGTAFALVWMTERTFYEQLVQGDPVQDVVTALAEVWTRSVPA
jgi:TetR/AcrR family transcriptional regulator, ethionamide resistance regulator